MPGASTVAGAPDGNAGRAGDRAQEPDGAARGQHQRDARRGELRQREAPPAARPRGAEVDDLRLHARADPRRDPGPEIPLGLAILESAGPHHDAAEIGEHGPAGDAVAQVRLQLRPLRGGELVIEVLGQPVGPLVAHRTPHRSRCCRRAIRARCSWDFEVPVARPSIWPISSCR